jgi:predicted O-methyltransferase YrrM
VFFPSGAESQGAMIDSRTRLVRLLFGHFLMREPAPAELQYFAERLAVDLDALTLIDALMDSAEYAARDVPLFVPPGHYYSPVVDPRKVLDRLPDPAGASSSDILGVDLDLEGMEGLWRSLLPHLQSAPFPESRSNAYRYWFLNPSYSFGDAIVLRAFILHYKPKRIIEVGSGYSSACMLDTISEARSGVQLICIDPHPELLLSLLRPVDREDVQIMASELQAVAHSTFEQLEDGDILFIDSTHVLKTGSDVVFALSEVLPRLNPGVIVHFHDAFYPFEYPASWISEGRSWNELYALRAFLTYNSAFRVIFFNSMFAALRRGTAEKTCPLFMRNPGGGLWLRRVK